jgi:tetratricopeptide (TPR) repeat protein
LAINPKYRDALVVLASVHNHLGSWEIALTWLEQAEKLYPNDYEILKGKAKSLMKLGRSSELEETYLKMRKIDPKDHAVLLYLGQIEIKKGNTIEGIELYRQAVEMEPESFMAWKMLIDTYEGLGMREEANAARQKFNEVQDKLRRSGTRIIPKFW